MVEYGKFRHFRQMQNIDFNLSITANQEETTSKNLRSEGSTKIQVVSLINFSLGGGISSENKEEFLIKISLVN